MSKDKKGSTLKPMGKEIHSTHNSPSSNPRGKPAAAKNTNPKISDRTKIPPKNKGGMPGSGLPSIPCYKAPH
jgi:hypothetical protein